MATKNKRQRAIKRADRWFSIYIRNKYGGRGCYTCGAVHRQMQCGHYISRGNHRIRWEEDNARPQCALCNLFRGGSVEDFRTRLVDEIGEERIEALNSIRTEKIPTEEIERLAKHWHEKCKENGYV